MQRCKGAPKKRAACPVPAMARWAEPDFLCLKLETGRQKGAKDSERSRHPSVPWRLHLLQKETITPTQQPPEELGVTGKEGNRPHDKSNCDFNIAYIMVICIDQYTQI